MTRIYQLFIPFFLLAGIVNGQVLKKQTLGINGSSHFVYANTTSYFIQESIGQGSVIRTYESGQYSLRQGFLQPIDGSTLTSSQDDELNAAIYPNPFDNEINVLFDDVISDVLYVTIFDITGRLVFERTYSPTEALLIRVQDVSSGHYLLNIRMRSQTLTAKLIKR